MAAHTIHTIDLKFQGIPNSIAAFIVETDEGGILIETGPETTREHLLKEITNLGFSPSKDIRGVFVTHIHLDHAGAAGWWANQRIPVHVHRRGARHLVDPTRLVESARAVYGNKFDQLWGEMQPAPEESIISLEDNDVTEIAGLKVRAIDTPGHAFHHHAFAIDDTLFAGDTAGAKVPGTNYTSVTSAPPQFDQEAYFSSLDRLIAEDFSRCFLTHFGEVETEPSAHFSDYKDAICDAISFVKDRLSENLEADALQVAYTAFQMERAFSVDLPPQAMQALQAANGTEMCADGIRMYLEKAAE